LKNRLLISSVFFITIVIINHNVNSQDNWWKDKKYKSEDVRIKYSKCKKVFLDIQDGLNYSNVYSIIPYFETEVYLNITSEDKGYYSYDQAKNILDNFLSNYPVSSFKWRNSSKSDNYAFASGKFKYKKNGYINGFDISISLNYIDDIWLIDQIIIN
jgi:hypothetical protein